MKYTRQRRTWFIVGACTVLLIVALSFSEIRTRMSASATTFTDVHSQDQEAKAIEFLQQSNVLSGYSDGSYRPNAIVNRAEWAKVLVVGTGNQPDAERYANCFPDVTKDWFAPYVCFGLAQGYWKGRPDGKFHPSDPVTMAEALKMVELVFDFDVESADGNAWYVPYRDAAKELRLIYDEEAARVDQPLSRAVMARLLLRTGLARISGQAFDERFLRFLEDEGKTFTDVLQDSALQHALAWEDNPNIQKEGWLLRIEPEGSASTFKMFRFHYRHHEKPFLAFEGVMPETYILPTIHIESPSGVSHLGLDGDASWEGIARPSDQYVEVDADTSGISKYSMNLQYDVRGRIVRITSAAGLLRGTFDLKTGAITGNPEITKNERSLHAWFASHNNDPFTVCVSDAPGFEAEIGIFADFRTVGIRPCGRPDFNPSPVTLVLHPPSTKPIFVIPGSGNGPKPPPPTGGGGGGPPPPLIIGGGNGGGPGGGPGGGNGGGGTLVGLPGTSHGETPGTGGGDPASPSSPASENSSTPRPSENPGEGYDNPTGNGDDLRRESARREQMAREGKEMDEGHRDAIEKDRDLIEEMAEEAGVELPPWKTPDVGAIIAACCPGREPGSCCKDLNMCTEDGWAKFLQRLGCLQDNLEAEQRKMAKAFLRLQFLLGVLPGLEKAEGHFQQLNVQKKILEAFIDAIVGGKGAKQFMRNILGEIADDQIVPGAGVFPRGLGTDDFPEDAIKEIVSRGVSAGGVGQLINEIGEKAADGLGLDGKTREKFQKMVKERFSENPIDIADPANWVKMFTVDLLGGVFDAADDFIKTVRDMQRERDELIKELYRLTMLYEAYADALKAVREACIRDACADLITQAKKEDEKDQAAIERLEEDGQMIIDIISHFLENPNGPTGYLVGGHPSGAEIKDRLIERLRLYLQSLGMNDCWFDLEFEVTIIYLPEGGYEWEISGFRFIKRSTPRPGCKELVRMTTKHSAAPASSSPPVSVTPECEKTVQECETINRDCVMRSQAYWKEQERCAKDGKKECAEKVDDAKQEWGGCIKRQEKCEDRNVYRECRKPHPPDWSQSTSATSSVQDTPARTSPSSSKSSLRSSSSSSSVRSSSLSSAASSVSTAASSVRDSAATSSAGFTCCESCPSNADGSRYYFPIEGTNCMSGDVKRPDLNEQSCVNPLYEAGHEPPVTYGSACSARPVGTWEFLNINDGWTATNDLPFGDTVHFIVASDGGTDVRTMLPISIYLWVNDALTYNVTFNGNPSQVCRGANGCSVDGPEIPEEWRTKNVRVEAYGKDGTFLSRHIHTP